MWEKTLLCHKVTVVQMRIPIHTVWPGQSLFVNIYYNIHWICTQTMKALISLHKCVGWSRHALSANCIRALFMHCSLYYCTEKIIFSFFKWKFSLGVWGQWRPRSACAEACASPQSDQGCLFSVAEAFDTKECTDRQQRLWWDCADVQDDLNMCILHILKDIILLDVTNLLNKKYYHICPNY